MPKETVYGESMCGPTELGEKPVVEVRWDRESGDVRIVSKHLSSIGGRLVDCEGLHYTDGMHVGLGRSNINDLIRHLRRARDQAFGRDE